MWVHVWTGGGRCLYALVLGQSGMVLTEVKPGLKGSQRDFYWSKSPKRAAKRGWGGVGRFLPILSSNVWVIWSKLQTVPYCLWCLIALPECQRQTVQWTQDKKSSPSSFPSVHLGWKQEGKRLAGKGGKFGGEMCTHATESRAFPPVFVFCLFLKKPKAFVFVKKNCTCLITHTSPSQTCT